MTAVEKIRAEVEAAKREAAANFDSNMGAGAFDALKKRNKKHNATALADICRVCDENGI